MPVTVKILRDAGLRPTRINVLRGPKIDLDYGPEGELNKVKFKGMHLPSISELLEMVMPRQRAMPVELALGPRYKSVLENQENEAAADRVNSAAVPEGEIWNITNIGASTNAAAGAFALYAYVTTVEFRFMKREATSQYIFWTGSIWLEEGQFIQALHANAGAIGIAILGRILYADV